VTGAVGAVSSVAEAVGAFVERWWKLAAFAVVVAAADNGDLRWQERIEQAKIDAAKAAYEAEFLKFGAARCAESERSMAYCRSAAAVMQRPGQVNICRNWKVRGHVTRNRVPSDV